MLRTPQIDDHLVFLKSHPREYIAAWRKKIYPDKATIKKDPRSINTNVQE